MTVGCAFLSHSDFLLLLNFKIWMQCYNLLFSYSHFVQQKIGLEQMPLIVCKL